MIASTSARALATTSSMRPGWMRPSAMSLVMAIRAISRRTGSKPDRMTVSGVSSMIRSMPVACSRARMLRPSRPMMRPFISSDGRWTTETVCSAVWSAATRWMAVTTMSRALSWASSRALPLDGPGDLDGVVLGLLADGLDEDALGVLGGHVGDALEGGDLLAVGAGELLAGLVELALAVEELAVALLEHVGALVELLVALRGGGVSRPASSARRARASSSASRCMRSFSSLASRIRSFWRARASASMRRASDVAAFIVCDAHRLRTKNADDGSADGGHDGHRQDEQGIHILFLPSGPHCGPDVRDAVGGSADRVGRRAGPLGEPRRAAGAVRSTMLRAARRATRRLVCRVAYGGTPRVNRAHA